MKNNRVELDTFIKSVCGNRSISPFHYGAVELPVDLDKSVEIQKRYDLL